MLMGRAARQAGGGTDV